jgi:hypothetical protein
MKPDHIILGKPRETFYLAAAALSLFLASFHSSM